jgi:hypothetical protein
MSAISATLRFERGAAFQMGEFGQRWQRLNVQRLQRFKSDVPPRAE